LDRFGKVAIVGVGLIGGSVGMALRNRGLAREVVGLGRSEETLRAAERLGAIDEGTTYPEEALSGASVVVVCTPVTRIAADVHSAAAISPPGALVTDAGSTKRRLVEAVEADDLARRKFVGAHPLAGSERKGAAAARADLFEGRLCVLTPTEHTPADRLETADRFWRSIGCRTRRMKVDEHDAALARTSHLPHAAAAALARVVPADWLELGAGAFRDGTRVAGAPGELWAGIFLDNRPLLLEALEEFRRELGDLAAALERGDEEGIVRWWEAARVNRERWAAGGAG
jgi:prephenate dehydrogenase